MNNAQARFQLEAEGIKTKGQALAYRFLRSLLEAPELEERLQVYPPTLPFNDPCLSHRKILSGQFSRPGISGSVLHVDTYPMHLRPAAEKAKTAG